VKAFSVLTSDRRPSRVRASPVYDVYWRFAAERQAIFFGRLEGAPQPWTQDEILQTYRFTNAYRASDRVSQFLIGEVIYNPALPTAPDEVVFRVLLFKLFNKISTWRWLREAVGALTWQAFDFARYDAALSRASAEGRKIYSAAYIVPPVSLDQTGVKHRGHLRLLEHILAGGFTQRLEAARGLREVFELLKSYPSLGDFLAFQLAIDLNYTDLVDHDEASFVVAGPGSRDGLAKTFPDAARFDPVDLIAVMADRQAAEFERLNLPFRDLYGRPLQLIDCQNLFCEVSKYTRVSHPQIAGLSGRTRVKQMFRPEGPLAAPWYPPKWGLNDRIPAYPNAQPVGDLFSRSDEAL
jgi:alpha-glutamyl/putrescinyl thymine pyrophosphorylase clade 1